MELLTADRLERMEQFIQARLKWCYMNKHGVLSDNDTSLTVTDDDSVFSTDTSTEEVHPAPPASKTILNQITDFIGALTSRTKGVTKRKQRVLKPVYDDDEVDIPANIRWRPKPMSEHASIRNKPVKSKPVASSNSNKRLRSNSIATNNETKVPSNDANKCEYGVNADLYNESADYRDGLEFDLISLSEDRNVEGTCQYVFDDCTGIDE